MCTCLCHTFGVGTLEGCWCYNPVTPSGFDSVLDSSCSGYFEDFRLELLMSIFDWFRTPLQAGVLCVPASVTPSGLGLVRGVGVIILSPLRGLVSYLIIMLWLF